MSGKTIAVLATLDTKGKEAEFLREQIGKHGQTALIMDVGVMGTPADEGGRDPRRGGRGGRHAARRSS